MHLRGIRGAITAENNSPAAILSATTELLQALVQANSVVASEIASVIFTTTRDLDAAYPARAAREMGWTDVALLCTHEMNVPGGVQRCIRVLIHWNSDRPPSDVVHVYLRGAASLRPDLALPSAAVVTRPATSSDDMAEGHE